MKYWYAHFSQLWQLKGAGVCVCVCVCVCLCVCVEEGVEQEPESRHAPELEFINGFTAGRPRLYTKDSSRTSHRIYYNSTRETNRWMPYTETIVMWTIRRVFSYHGAHKLTMLYRVPADWKEENKEENGSKPFRSRCTLAFDRPCVPNTLNSKSWEPYPFDPLALEMDI